MIQFLSKYKIIGIAIFLWVTIFFVYLQTLAPSIGFIDSGELATVSITLGIAHPTGYPLFALLSKVFSMLPIGVEEIVRLNIFSALMTSFASLMFFFLMVEFLQVKKEGLNNDKLGASVLGTLFLSFSKTFWSQSVSIEVYSLHVFLTCSVLFVFIKALKQGDAKLWVFFSFLVGIAFTNHLTTVLIAPALLYLFFVEHGFSKNTFIKIRNLGIPFILGFSVYLYLPIRALQNPILNWGNPITIEKFWWHFTGKQFSVFMFSSSEVAKKQLSYFFENLPNEFFVTALILSLFGLFLLLFSNRRNFIFVLLLFCSCLAYSINYDIHDIDSYFLLSFITIAICLTFGILKILERFETIALKIFSTSVLLIFIVLQVLQVYPKVNQTDNFLVEDYTKNILTNLPHNAIILSYQWDYFVAASYYFQHVKKIRPDVVVLDKELFRRSWYFPQLETLYPELIKKSKKEVDLFLEELYKFEHDLPYDFNTIEGRYTALLRSFMENNDSSEFYITPEIEPQYTSGYIRVPDGFLFKLVKDTVYQTTNKLDIKYRDFSGTDKYSYQLKMLQLNAFIRRATYEQSFGKDSLFKFYLQKVSEMKAKLNPQVSNF